MIYFKFCFYVLFLKSVLCLCYFLFYFLAMPYGGFLNLSSPNQAFNRVMAVKAQSLDSWTARHSYYVFYTDCTFQMFNSYSWLVASVLGQYRSLIDERIGSIMPSRLA